jgi:ABC-type lipoprotein release transport system permease subunit
LRTVELARTCLAALLVLAGPLALMVVLLPRLVEPDPGLPPQMPVHVTGLPLLFSAGVAVAVTVVAALAAARRSAALKPGEVLRDDT